MGFNTLSCFCLSMTPAQEKDSRFSVLHYYRATFLKLVLVSPFYRNMFQIQVNHWHIANQIAIEMWQNSFHHTWCAWPIGYALLSPEAKLRWIQMSAQDHWRTAVVLWWCQSLTAILQILHHIKNKLESSCHFGRLQHLHGRVVRERLREDLSVTLIKKVRWACWSGQECNKAWKVILSHFIVDGSQPEGTSSYFKPCFPNLVKATGQSCKHSAPT